MSHGLFQHEVRDQLPDSGIVFLRQPEERLAAHARVAILARDAQQLIDGGLVIALREHEDRVLAQVELVRIAVDARQLRGWRLIALSGPEERRLAQLQRLARVERALDEPASARALVFLHALDDRFLELMVFDARKEIAQIREL